MCTFQRFLIFESKFQNFPLSRQLVGTYLVRKLTCNLGIIYQHLAINIQLKFSPVLNPFFKKLVQFFSKITKKCIELMVRSKQMPSDNWLLLQELITYKTESTQERYPLFSLNCSTWEKQNCVPLLNSLHIYTFSILNYKFAL